MRNPIRSSFAASARAFTLLEILVVLAIIGLLVGLGVTKFGSAFSSSQGQVAQLFVNNSIKTPLTQYRIDMGDYPSTQDGLQALLVAPQGAGDRWKGPYLDVNGGKLPLDPWGQPYNYVYPGTHNKDGYDVFSFGPKKQAGDESGYIGNW